MKMFNINRSAISFLLSKIAESLDISNSEFDDAEKKYRAIGAWLGDGNSPLAKYSPQIYPQGSFLLGTVTKPLGDSSDYDIDLVFELAIPKSEISQKDLKRYVGNRLRAHEVYRRLLDAEGRRCWTLQYAETARLHLDILPAVPDNEVAYVLRKQGVISSFANTSIAITDNTLLNYEDICLDWPRCNPKGFAAWFRQRMIMQFTKQQMRMQEALKAEVENVPEYRIKTSLQRCVQLLKRHRDVMFEKDQENKPASIIFTTLAAHAYGNEDDITDAMAHIIEGMPKFITKRNGRSWVANPVDPSENFADRWGDSQSREPRFMQWLVQLRTDIGKLIEYRDIDEITGLLSAFFGEKLSKAAAEEYKKHGSPTNDIATAATVSKPHIVSITRADKPWGL
jgi:hypothetical protein